MNEENKTIESRNFDDESSFMTLADAATLSSYTPEHLNLLCRRGELQGKKIGRNWYTTREWLNEFLYLSKSKAENLYISLSKAATLSSYTPEHLNLLCRKGILQGKKLGRNWQTTREWLNEFLYLSKSSEKKHYVRRRKKRKEKLLAEVQKEFEQKEKQKLVSLYSFKGEDKENFETEKISEGTEVKFLNRLAKIFLKLSAASVISFLIFFSVSFFQYVRTKNYIAEKNISPNFSEDIFLFDEGGVVEGEENVKIVKGEEDAKVEGSIAASENYKIKEISFGGTLIASASGENLGMEIYDIKSDMFSTKNGKEAQVLISWKTNKLAVSEISYSKNNSTSSKTLQEKYYGFNHSVILTKLDLATTYVYQIKARDRWGNEISSEKFGAYTGSKMLSVFDLILEAVDETFSWAVKK